jgi:hypothetical protein
MKHIYFLSVALVLICNVVLGQLSNGLKAHYNFTENTIDSSGYTNHGTTVGNPVYTADRSGNVKCAVKFSGHSSEYISVNYSNDFNIQPDSAFSISLWYQGGTADVGDFEGLFKKNNNEGEASPSNTDYHVGLYDLNTPVAGSKYSGLFNSSFQYVLLSGDTSWHHIVLTYQDTIWTQYIDSSYFETDVTKKYPIYTSTGNIVLGQSFGGKLDDVRFYDRKLSLLEVGELYRLPCECHKTVTSIESVRTSALLYPNPTQGILVLNNIAERALYELSDMGGKTIKSGTVSSSKIDVSFLSPGIYFLRFPSENLIFRFVKT